MSMSLCGGEECIVCTCNGLCLAGNGDDDFSFIGKDGVLKMLNNGKDRSGKVLSEDNIKFLRLVLDGKYSRTRLVSTVEVVE